MDLLQQYGSESDSEGAGPAQGTSGKTGNNTATSDSTNFPSFAALRAQAVSAAPAVDTKDLALTEGGDVASAVAVRAERAPDLNTRTLKHNPKYEDLYGGDRGGEQAEAELRKALRNHTSGFVEDTALPGAVFELQYNEFNANKTAEAPSGQRFGESTGTVAKRKRTEAEVSAERAAREEKRAAKEAMIEAQRAAAATGGAFRLKAVQPWADKEARQEELTEEQKEYLAKVEAEKKAKEAEKQETEGEARTTWHGGQGKDWQGRSWLQVPKGTAKNAPDTCFLPKRWIHTWGADGNGHTKGVNAIKFLPKSGHLLLSAGLDSKVKMWDVNGSGKCLRTYMGHTAGVRAVTFNHDGSKFISTAYDKKMCVWDTETGKVIRTIRNNNMFYCATLHPDPAKQNIMLAGASDKKVYQFDLDTGDMVQEYHYHLAAVNTITFIEEGKMFVSTSDDKTLRVWELGVPVQVKYIADPSMHSMPAVAEHPNGKALCYQSLDNQIITYNTVGRFRQNRKKTFKGHMTSGHACQVGFSPDGQFIMSGDGGGKLFFWNWAQPSRIVKTIPAHDKTVCIGCEWHPLETSKVATCGWDGLIKYWD